MGVINCRTDVRFQQEDIKAEADISNPQLEKIQYTKNIFRQMTGRVLASREKLLSSVQEIFKNSTKNFDPYYAFLLDQLKTQRFSTRCSTATDSIANLYCEKNNKENMASIKYIKRSTNQSRPKSRTNNCRKAPPGVTNVYLYVETPCTGLLSKGGKLKPLVPNSSKSTTRIKSNLNITNREDSINQTCTNILKKAAESRAKTNSILGNQNTKKLVNQTHEKRFSILDDTTTTPSKTLDVPEIRFDLISLLPNNIQVKLMSYLIDQYRVLQCVSAVWHSMTLTTMDNLFNPVENQLILKSNDYFAFRNSFTQSTLCKNGCWQGVRVDRVIQLELLKGHEGKTLGISYLYSFANDPKTMYRTQYKIDAIGKGSKSFWLHNSENIITGRKYTHTMNIGQICTGDIIEISINYYTARGLINIQNLEWEEIEEELTPINEIQNNNLSTTRGSVPDIGNNGKMIMPKVKADLNRMCELETMGAEWYDTQYYNMQEAFCDLRAVSSYFIVDSIEFASLDVKACKLKMTAYKPGILSREIMGIPIHVKPHSSECINECKRLGLMIDRECDIQLRVGDQLIFYMSKHHHE